MSRHWLIQLIVTFLCYSSFYAYTLLKSCSQRSRSVFGNADKTIRIIKQNKKYVESFFAVFAESLTSARLAVYTAGKSSFIYYTCFFLICVNNVLKYVHNYFENQNNLRILEISEAIVWVFVYWLLAGFILNSVGSGVFICWRKRGSLVYLSSVRLVLSQKVDW